VNCMEEESEALIRQIHHDPPKAWRDGLCWRRARNQRRGRNNSRRIGSTRRCYHPDHRKQGRDQRTGWIDRRRLNTCVAIRARGGLRRGFVVMKQAPEQSEEQDRNNRKTFDGREIQYDSLCGPAHVAYRILVNGLIKRWLGVQCR
jgi:hypothetical protein